MQWVKSLIQLLFCISLGLQPEIDVSLLSGFPLEGIPPCPRLYAGGSDHLSRVMVKIPREELGGISHRLVAVHFQDVANELSETDAIHEQLRALREKFIAAVNAKDYEAVVVLLHPEVILTAQDGKKLNLIRRHEGVRKYFNRLLVSPGHGVESLKLNPTVDDLSVLYHNNTAIAFGKSIDHYRFVSGNEFDLKTRWSVTVVKEEDKWLVACLHVSTNLFENPVLATVSRMAIWLAIGAGFVCLVAGLFIGRLRSRPVEA